MAKIDVTKIENFDTMTPEEKIQAFLEYEIPDGTEEVKDKYKKLMNKANAEAKQYKDRAREAEEKLKSQMSEDERTQAEQAEHYRQLEAENAKLKKDALIAQKTNFYQSIGFGAELAKETAEVFAEGDMETVEKNTIFAHNEFEKNLRADVFRQNPHPTNSGEETKTYTKADIMKVKDAEERQRLIAENIELFQ